MGGKGGCAKLLIVLISFSVLLFSLQVNKTVGMGGEVRKLWLRCSANYLTGWRTVGLLKGKFIECSSSC